MDEDVKTTLIDNISYCPDTGLMFWKLPKRGRKMDRPIGSYDAYGYLQFSVNGKKLKVHRVVFLLMGEEIPKYVDHINCIKDDNRWCNLRPCYSVSHNQYNQKRKVHNTSGYKGVYYNKLAKKWQASIQYGGNRVYLGLFETAKDAHDVYCEAARKFHGDYANYG